MSSLIFLGFYTRDWSFLSFRVTHLFYFWVLSNDFRHRDLRKDPIRGRIHPQRTKPRDRMSIRNPRKTLENHPFLSIFLYITKLCVDMDSKVSSDTTDPKIPSGIFPPFIFVEKFRLSINTSVLLYGPVPTVLVSGSLSFLSRTRFLWLI